MCVLLIPASQCVEGVTCMRCCFFFFQAEDGIRDIGVTGVQTCALPIFEQTPGVDVALIDIMMPDMDGYETMREIRRLPELSGLPLIAVTAKAMKGDRQKCLDAGASDYIAKPVDIELLLALLRVWVARAREGQPAGALPVPLDAAD